MKILIMLLSVLLWDNSNAGSKLPQETMNPIELIQYQGYPAEGHTVETSDGYLLGVQRIPHGMHGPMANAKYRPPVLLMHGLGGSSVNWISNMWNESFAFILADQGFDVWLGNCRGNIYSQKHVSLGRTDANFWHFSWEQMADYDLPATVDYILKETGYSQLYYAGHSQGTLIGFAKLSEDIEFSRKIKTFFALAPVGTVSTITSTLVQIAKFTEPIYAIVDALNIQNLGDLTWILQYIAKEACDHENEMAVKLCDNILVNLLGVNYGDNLNVTNIPTFISHNPAGESVQDIVHFGQMVEAKQMQKFDYGWSKNWWYYHWPSPPAYDVRNIETDTVLIWSDKDTLADPTDVKWLIGNIQNQRAIHLTGYTHFDFIWALDAKEKVYQPIIDMMQNRAGRFI